MKKTVLITDVDNTLFDWVDVWHASFTSMMETAAKITGVPLDEIYDAARAVHQKHGTSEYAFVLEEIPAFRNLYGVEVTTKLAPAIDAFRQARRTKLKLYNGVESTLVALRERGVLIVAYTESMAYYTNYRFRKLGLDHLVDHLYSPPDHQLPVESPQEIRHYPPDVYEMSHTIHSHTPAGELKPNPHILQAILSDQGRTSSESVYIGDSLMKDIAMAQQAGVDDVHASYGVAQHREQYELLKRVTHWTAADVTREQQITNGATVTPNRILSSNFGELLQLFDWGSQNAR